MSNTFKDRRPFSVKLKSFFQSLLFWKGRKKGVVYTIDIKWDDIRQIFFPKTFHEKYSYLGSIPWKEEGEFFDIMKPLILLMDLEAKPWWCPRWFLRFLHVFGDDKSIVRVRNYFWSNLKRRITRGILMWDYKTKWEWYDLRISISAPKYLQDLADNIEFMYYRNGHKQDMIKELSEIETASKETKLEYASYCELISLYEKYIKSPKF